ncbi:MAG: amino acid ABC transporter substrate-binding protein [Acidobacteria bacterium]|nr:amino acid ABC transporter substrate-binding protein [Acidobacteriota bacterium]
MAATSNSEITAGLSVSQSGKLSIQGLQAHHGISLWESYANAGGGIRVGAGRRLPVRLITYDDRSRSDIAEENVLRLLRQDHVDILLGPYSSALTLAAGRLAEEHRKLLWNHGGASDEISHRGQEHLVSVLSPASSYLSAFPSWLQQNLRRLKRMSVLFSSRGTFGSHVGRGLVEAARFAGFEVHLIPMDAPVREAKAVVRRISSTDPHVLVLAGSFQDEVQLMRERGFFPASVKAVAAVGAGIQSFWQELGEAAEGVIGPSQWEPEVRFEEIRGPDSDWFVRNFKDRFGQRPDYPAAGGFALGLVLMECIARAGSLDDQQLRRAAAELDFNTFYGRFRLDPETGRQAGHQIVLVQWRQGRTVVLEAA